MAIVPSSLRKRLVDDDGSAHAAPGVRDPLIDW
jgi:hypothetical protein